MSQERLNRHQRPIAKRIIVRGLLILDTPTCLGSGDAESPTDLALVRDSISNCALLTGASIAGALRNYLRECEHGYSASEQKSDRATTLFGGTRRDPDGEQSPLIIHDAISKQIPTVELRDGVAIDSKTGTAKDRQKYDLELLAAGTEFPLSFELLVEKDQKTSEQQALINCLASALEGLEKSEIGLGMKKRRGFGRCHVKEWQVWNFNLEDAGDRNLWLNFEHWHTELLPNPTSYPSIKEAFENAGIQLDVSAEDKRDRFLIHATFKLVGSLLIRSGQDSTGRAPDVVHLKSHRPNKSEPLSVLSGTSLAGVLRHRAERIVKTLGSCSPIVDNLFGYVVGKQSQASRLVVHEKVIKDATELVQNRIAIDRFTGGAYHGALFDEQPIFGGDNTVVTIQLELRKPEMYEMGLLLLLLKDLWTSDLPVGGESSIGRGRLKGIQADLIRHHPDNPQHWEIREKDRRIHVTNKINPSQSEQSVRDEMNGFVKSLVQYLGKEIEKMSHAIADASQEKVFSDSVEFHSWLKEKATAHQLTYLLAHADDGVIWGRFDNGKLTTAEQVFYPCNFNVYFPKLRLLTLQQCRIFGKNGEVLLWRMSDKKFKWRLIGNPEEDKISESQILWGTNGIKKDNFTLLWDGSQGLKHAVPFIDIELKGDRLAQPVRLVVHHYITYDGEGVARIYRSRLVDLYADKTT